MRKIMIAALCSASFAGFSAPAMAQEETASTYEDIIVQVRRRDESIQEVPSSVLAVSGDDLQKLEIRQLEDVSKVAPGLSLSTSSAGQAVASLRGVSFDTRASGSNSSVEFYRNDAVLTGGAALQALYDVGQIEVLRGPQGTLKGRATPSGSISITTKRPDLYEVGGYVSGSFAEDDKRNVNGALNIPILEGKLGARIAGTVGSNRGNLVKGLNLQNGAIDDNIYDRSSGIRASIRAKPFDDIVTLDFSYEGLNRNQRSYSQVQSFRNALSTAPASPVAINPCDYLGVQTVPNSI